MQIYNYKVDQHTLLSDPVLQEAPAKNYQSLTENIPGTLCPHPLPERVNGRWHLIPNVEDMNFVKSYSIGLITDGPPAPNMR